MRWHPDHPNDCALCGRGQTEYQDIGGLTFAKCARCGEYAVPAVDLLNIGWHRPFDPFLACAARQNWEDTGKQLAITLDTEAQLASRHNSTGPSENTDRLLRCAARRIKRPGRETRFVLDDDFTLVDAVDATEFDQYISWLKRDGLIEIEIWAGRIVSFKLTQAGWARATPAGRVGGTPGTCFVAMWFDAITQDAYELGIAAAVEKDCGLRSIRIDRKEHNNQITDEIMAEIRGAEFMVADFTGHRAGVYYEAGFARGLGRTVIYCCREDAFGERHFDTSVMNHIVWSDPADLRKRLADRIKATILPKA
jgi:hypothetical protein